MTSTRENLLPLLEPLSWNLKGHKEARNTFPSSSCFYRRPRAEALTADDAYKPLLHCLSLLFPQIHHLWRPTLQVRHFMVFLELKRGLLWARMMLIWVFFGPLPLSFMCFGNNNTIYAFKIRNNVIKSYSDIQEKTIFWKLDILPSSGLCWC